MKRFLATIANAKVSSEFFRLERAYQAVNRQSSENFHFQPLLIAAMCSYAGR
jgi:hypothetical protein